MFDEEDDIIDDNELQAIMDQVIENSMRSAYSTIEELGVEGWIKEKSVSVERKLRITKRMIGWFEEREEFEKCAVLMRSIKQLEAL
jgi:protein-arginine kinase activator protein McsA